MHGQPLCLSKTLQQLPARDKSNHSQPTPPFPPPTHKHTHQYTFLLSVSLSHTHTHTDTHVYMHISLSAGFYKDAAISSSLCHQSKVFPANHFVFVSFSLTSEYSRVKHRVRWRSVGGITFFFFISDSEQSHGAQQAATQVFLRSCEWRLLSSPLHPPLSLIYYSVFFFFFFFYLLSSDDFYI